MRCAPWHPHIPPKMTCFLPLFTTALLGVTTQWTHTNQCQAPAPARHPFPRTLRAPQMPMECLCGCSTSGLGRVHPDTSKRCAAHRPTAPASAVTPPSFRPGTQVTSVLKHATKSFVTNHSAADRRVRVHCSFATRIYPRVALTRAAVSFAEVGAFRHSGHHHRQLQRHIPCPGPCPPGDPRHGHARC